MRGLRHHGKPGAGSALSAPQPTCGAARTPEAETGPGVGTGSGGAQRQTPPKMSPNSY